MALTRGTRTGPRIGRAEHLAQRRDFLSMRKGGRRGGDDVVRMLVAKNGLAWSRVAAAVSKRYGNAVARNKLRRLYKEAFRLEKAALPAGYDLLLSPPKGSGPPNLRDLRASLVKCARRVAKQLERRPR